MLKFNFGQLKIQHGKRGYGMGDNIIMYRVPKLKEQSFWIGNFIKKMKLTESYMSYKDVIILIAS